MMQVEYCRLARHFSEKLNVVMPTLLTVAFCLLAYFLPTLTKTWAVSTVTFSFLTFVLIYVFAESVFSGQVTGEPPHRHAEIDGDPHDRVGIGVSSNLAPKFRGNRYASLLPLSRNDLVW